MLFFLYGNNVQVCAFFLLEEFYSYTENIRKKDNDNNIKQNETKKNYVQRTTIYNSHIDNQQINSSGTAYLLMCPRKPEYAPHQKKLFDHRIIMT